MEALIGIALWALIPGFVARKKGRSFWGYYFLSFLISPLITMIITFCLSNLNKTSEKTYLPQEKTTITTNEVSFSDKVVFCRKCGEKLLERSQFCSKCGTEITRIGETNDEV